MPRRLYFILFGFIALLALLLRLEGLERRPMHVDEAVQAFKSGVLLETGIYHYNPEEFHGPTLYYFTQPFYWLSGVKRFADSSEWHYRLQTVLAGVLLIAVLMLLADGLGLWATIWAGLLIAVSPAMVYYSRFYIQEMPLVLFTLATIATGWRYAHSRKLRWALAMGASVGLMHATKETSVLAWAAILGALALAWHDMQWRRRPTRLPRRGHMLAAVAVALAISMTLHSSLYSHPQGILDSFGTFTHYLQRSGGEGSTGDHRQPWHYYLGLLAFHKDSPGPWFSELPVLLLGLCGIAAAAGWGRRTADGSFTFCRFIAIYTLLLTLIYSVIPYKIPWLLLSFYSGWLMLAGLGAARLAAPGRRRWVRALIGLGILATAGWLGKEARVASLRFDVDVRNPWVYSQAGRDVLRLAKRVEQLAEVHPQGRQLLIHVIGDDYWPLPFYLRRMEQVGYWTAPPEDSDADLLLVEPALVGMTEERLRRDYQSEYYGLRNEVLITALIERGLWERFLARVTAPAQGSAE